MSEAAHSEGSRAGGRSLSSIVIVGLLGLAGLVYLIWPKQAPVTRLEASESGAAWAVHRDKAVFSGPTMGTRFNVVLHGEGFDHGKLEALGEAVEAELAEVNAQMSTYIADSELSRFNEAPAGQAVEVSSELVEVIELAIEVHGASGGAFDVTVGPLVDAWGFGPDPREREELSAATIAELRSRLGVDKLEIAGRSLRKTSPDIRVDLSAIAKGHGSDRVAAVVAAAGFADFMVEIGGEVRAQGEGPSGLWKIGVERPTADASGAQAVQRILQVGDAAVATSGDYRNYWQKDGVRYSHTIDPRTGRPIAHTLASVTVIHRESAALADAWATALNVLGPDDGPALAAELGLAAYFLIRKQDGYRVQVTPAFEQLDP